MKNRQEDKMIQERLASLETFPDGIQPNRDELWNRLNNTLPPPKKNNKSIFWWTGIAACAAGLFLFFMMHSSVPLIKEQPAKRQMSATVKHSYLQPEMQELQSIKPQQQPPSARKRKKSLSQPARTTTTQPVRATTNEKKKAIGTYLVSVGGTPLAFDTAIPDLIAY